MEALAHANEIRRAGALIRREVTELGLVLGRQRAIELLRDPPPALQHMRVGHFLGGIHRFGCRKVTLHLSLAGLHSGWNRPIGGERRRGRERPLTERERLYLADVLEGLS